MVPMGLHKAVEAARRLDRIEWLEITGTQKNPTDNTTYYTIHVFVRREQHRLPVTRLHHKPEPQCAFEPMAKPSRSQPDFSIQRSFEEFQSMRDATLLAVQQAHDGYCHLCNDFQTLFVFTSTRPAMALKWLLPTATRVEVLHKLLHSLVTKFQTRRATVGRRNGCQGVHEVPTILHRFVLEEEY